MTANSSARAFQDLNFGWADASTEASLDPDLLIRGFWDLGGIINEIRDGHRFVVLGNKGTGKTAIAEHLKFLSENDPSTFVSNIDLADFPYNDLRKLVDDDQNDTALPSAWSWLLLVHMLGSFGRDNGGNIARDETLSKIYEGLDRIGLLPAGGKMKDILNLSRSRQIEVALPVKLKLNTEETNDYHIPFFTEKLRSALLNFQSDNLHLFVIDGLDEVLNLTEKHFEPISGLLASTFRINTFLRQRQIRAKIVLLCRTDLFDRIPGSNTNKIRQDSSIRLNWFTTDDEASPLWKMINRRAAIQLNKDDVDVARDYFPPSLRRKDSDSIRVLPKEPAQTKTYLLRQTRYTPRDFVELFTKIRDMQKHRGVEAVLDQGVIASALKEYATEYFLPEIRNELDGYCAQDAKEALFSAFGTIRDSRFTLKDIKDLMPPEVRDEVPGMLSVLFDCSAIGHWESVRRQSFRYFRYKDPNCRLNIRQTMVLHPALGIAFNTTEAGEALLELDEIPGQIFGTVAKVRPNGGLVRGDNGTIYHYYRTDLIASVLHSRAPVVGMRVSFQDGPKTSPTDPYPSALHVRVLEE